MYNQGCVLPTALQKVLENEVLSDERVLWMGQPYMKRIVRRAVGLGVFILLWLGVTLAIAANLFKNDNAPIFVKVFTVFFVLFGLAASIAPFLILWIARSTVYAVTDKRAIIIKKGPSVHIESFMAEQLQNVQKRGYHDGSGSLIFDRQVITRNYIGRNRDDIREIGFFGISEVDRVYQLLCGLAEGH